VFKGSAEFHASRAFRRVRLELRPHGIKVGVICPGGVKTEFALGRGRTEEGVSNSDMLEPEDVAGAVLLACKQSPGARIIEIQMRTMAESLA
jgi:NADP-dependent 3-hydroxy acid dehydrogenase YdfG